MPFTLRTHLFLFNINPIFNLNDEGIVTCTQSLINNYVKKSYHMAVQSKWTIIHLDGLNANELAYSMPSMKCLYSGQTNAVPAYAASMCIHISSSMPMGQKCCTVKSQYMRKPGNLKRKRHN